MGRRWRLAPSPCPYPLPGGGRVVGPCWGGGHQGVPCRHGDSGGGGSGPTQGWGTPGPCLSVPTAPRDRGGLWCQPSVLPGTCLSKGGPVPGMDVAPSPWPWGRMCPQGVPDSWGWLRSHQLVWGCHGPGDGCVPILRSGVQWPWGQTCPHPQVWGTMALGTDVSPMAGPGPLQPHPALPGLSTPGCPCTAGPQRSPGWVLVAGAAVAAVTGWGWGGVTQPG